jgi:short-subunit dehydrogenase
VVLVALGDPLLDEAHAELSAAYPGVQFRKVPADLGRPGYVEAVRDATADVDVQVVFCNAGYVLTGLFESHPLERQLANLECNAVSAVALTHLLLERMLAKRLRGCFVYTSSAAAAIPGPFSVLYASTKAFLAAFGASLAGEVRSAGIDVLVFHPSPVASRFYDKAHKLDALEFFKKLAVDPDDLPDTVFASIGRLAWRDIGPTALGFRLLMKVLDYNLFAMLIAATAHLTGDFKKHGGRRAAAGGGAAGKAD